MKRIIITLFFVLTFLTVNAQKEATYWYFGDNSGLDFSRLTTVNSVEDVPTAIVGPISRREGCFTISDFDGTFMFASDGSTVYTDGTGTVMDGGTGLHGHNSSTQSGLVIPIPKSSSKYFLVTVDAIEDRNKGVNYSIIDMDGNNGKGKVIQKNIPLGTGASGIGRTTLVENIVAVANQDKNGFWLIHRAPTHFIVWKVTKDGIDPVPEHIINAQYAIPSGGTNDNFCGYLVLSPDGRYIAHAGGATGRLTFGEFDSKTGEIANVLVKNLATNKLYGVEFSPSGEYLYYSHWSSSTVKRLPTANIATAQPYVIGGDVNGALQTGPDGKIYGVNENKRNLTIIHNPNEGGSELSTLTNYLRNNARLGLPTFNVSFFRIRGIEGEDEICINEESEYIVKISQGGTGKITKLIWNFGDGSPLVEDADMSQTEFKQKHSYGLRGYYTIKVTAVDEHGVLQPRSSQEIQILVGSCMIPVNHNTSNHAY